MNKLVSIVLPTYNGEKYIKESINSILEQTYQHWELIIVNDCSADNTLSIITEYKNKDSRIKIINNINNYKLPKSLNIGFREVCGEYYTWTSDDNIFKKNAIETMAEYLEENQNIDLVSCKYDEIDESGKFLRAIDRHNKRDLFRFLRRNIVGACFMYRKSIADIAGEYDETMFCAEDYDYWCRIALAGNVKFLPYNLYQYRINSGSLSATRKKLVKEKILEVREKYVVPIMQKLNYNDKKQIQTLIKLYLRDKTETVWLKKCIDIDDRIFFKSIILNPFVFVKLLCLKDK